MIFKRESRQFWAIDDENHTVELVKGYVCEKNPGCWWVPEMGWTGNVGHQLFDRKVEALAALLSELCHEQAVLNDAITRLQDELDEAHLDTTVS